MEKDHLALNVQVLFLWRFSRFMFFRRILPRRNDEKACWTRWFSRLPWDKRCLKVEKMIENGDEKAKLIYDAMAYQVAKEIGAASVCIRGES